MGAKDESFVRQCANLADVDRVFVQQLAADDAPEPQAAAHSHRIAAALDKTDSRDRRCVAGQYMKYLAGAEIPQAGCLVGASGQAPAAVRRHVGTDDPARMSLESLDLSPVRCVQESHGAVAADSQDGPFVTRDGDRVREPRRRPA